MGVLVWLSTEQLLRNTVLRFPEGNRSLLTHERNS